MATHNHLQLCTGTGKKWPLRSTTTRGKYYNAHIRGEWSGDDKRMRGENQAGQKSIRKNAEIVTERDIMLLGPSISVYTLQNKVCLVQQEYG